jgi:hypothetical protein
MATLLYTIPFSLLLAFTGKTSIPATSSIAAEAPAGTYLFVVKDTVVKTSNAMVPTFSVNGQLPPKILTLKSNEPVSVSFRNDTHFELVLVLPKELLPGKPSREWTTVQPGQTFQSNLQTQKAGIYYYRITRMEQKGNGVKGMVVINK